MSCGAKKVCPLAFEQKLTNSGNVHFAINFYINTRKCSTFIYNQNNMSDNSLLSLQ